jgi:hypothetical protein
VPGAGGDEVAVYDDGPVYIEGAALLRVHRAFGDGGYRAAGNAVGGGEDFDPVADGGDRLLGLEEMPRDAQQVLVLAQVFRRTPTGNEETGEF